MDAVDAHENFRGRNVDKVIFLTRSHDRFESLFKLYSERRDRQLLRQELQELLKPRAENIALVIVQAALALVVKANSQAVLNLAKEAPEEWMRVLFAEDGDMFIGAPIMDLTKT
jgi:hexokinase